MSEGCCDRYYDNMPCDCHKRNAVSLALLKNLLLQHDKYISHGYYEGYGIYKYLIGKLNIKEDITGEAWEKEMENV